MDFNFNRNDYYFLETDSTFNLAQHVFNELQPNLNRVYTKTVAIERIRSAGNGDYMFGSFTTFSRTASASFRKCFVKSANIAYSPSNSDNLERQETSVVEEDWFPQNYNNRQPIVLANDKVNATFCNAKYDQLNPLFIIKDKINQQDAQEWSSKMIIVKSELNRLVYVTTQVTYSYLGQCQVNDVCKQEIHCKVWVKYDYYVIINPDNLPPRALNPFRLFMDPANYIVSPVPRERPVERDDEGEQPGPEVEEESEDEVNGEQQAGEDSNVGDLGDELANLEL